MGARARAAILLLAVMTGSAGCYTARMQRMETSLGSLAAKADSDSVALSQMRRDLGEQKDILLSLKAGSNTTSKELVDRLEELSNKLDDTVQRMSSLRYQNPIVNRTPGDTTYIGSSAGAGPPGGSAPPVQGGDAEQMYEQAAKDFTQGRFELALAGFRGLLAAAPNHELADNALYGVGESFYALAKYDSAQVAYQQVEQRYPKGDRVPAALYKLGMTYEKLGDKTSARATFQRLQQKYPRSGEAKLADERLKELGK
jgi:tol-pal system protein YbgF